MADIAQYINYDFSMDYKEAKVTLAQITEEVELPSRYDMRELGRVSPVRDQGLYGTCWAFASLAALETTLTPQENLVFSPDHMSLCNSFSLGQNEGGEYTMAIAYLASWQGPVYESDDPYGDGETDETLEARKHLEEAFISTERLKPRSIPRCGLQKAGPPIITGNAQPIIMIRKRHAIMTLLL